VSRSNHLHGTSCILPSMLQWLHHLENWWQCKNFGWTWRHKSRCVVSWLHNLFFMKVKLMKVLSSFTKPNTITIVISTTFMYSLNLWTRRVEDYIFKHIWVIGFTSLDSCIIVSTLWLMVSLKWEAWTSSCLESRSLSTIDPPFNLLSTQNANLIRFKWGKKLLANISSHIQYYDYTMPRAAMTFTSGNLLNNSKHKFEATFKHWSFQAWQFGQPRCTWTHTLAKLPWWWRPYCWPTMLNVMYDGWHIQISKGFMWSPGERQQFTTLFMNN